MTNNKKAPTYKEDEKHARIYEKGVRNCFEETLFIVDYSDMETICVAYRN